MLENFSWFILVPVWVSILIMGARFIGLGFSKKNIVIMSVISTLFSAMYSGYGLFYTFHNSPVEMVFPFLSLGGINFELGVYVDMLNSLIGLTVSIITFAIYIYSVFYMDSEKSFSRFYSLMNLFNTTILGFVFAPNLFQMLLFWESIGAVSYLLIGFWYEKPSVSADAKRVFLINVIGDICLFAGFVISSALVCLVTNNMSLAGLPFSDLNLITSSLIASTNPHFYTFICLLFVVAALVKSAQFPINSWLINAMSAPTPVSALIHSSTLVMTGIFLLMRIFPIVASDTLSVKILIAAGLITAIITSISALVQTNIKKVLAYSTSAQLGLVFLALGCYNPIAGVVYLVSHAFIKSLLFMCAGIVIRLVDNKNILFMGNFRKCAPIVALCFIVGALALSGIGFCGLNAKHFLINIYCTSLPTTLLFGFVSILTTLYIFRLYFLVFENTASFECEDLENYTNPKLYNIGYSMIIFMSVVVILLTFVMPAGQLCPLYILNIVMILAAYYLYNTRFKMKKNPVLHHILINGFYINKIYYWGEIILYKYFTKLMAFVDYYILGGLEYIEKTSAIFLSKTEHKMQSNNFQSYISYGVWVLIVAMFLFSIIYLLILNLFGV